MNDHATTFPDWLKSRADSSPDRLALIAGGKSWSFASLDTDATRMARRLAGLGVKSGDRVATLLHNCPIAAILPHAVLRLGATLVPLNVRLSESEAAWQLNDAKPVLLIVDSRTVETASRAKHENQSFVLVGIDAASAKILDGVTLELHKEVDTDLWIEHDPQHVLAVIYTSGTTGHPKGAMLTVSNFWWSAAGSALNLGTQTDDRWIACLPLFHVGGMSILIRCAIYGITALVHDGFDADAVNADIENNRATIVSVVSVMLQRMLDRRGDRPYPSSLRCVLLGGGPAPQTLLQKSATLGVPVIQTYGLTETCSQVATLSPDDALARLGSAGKPLYPNGIRIAHENGDASSSEAGEILVRGPVVMAGYFNDDEATSNAIRNGWLHTGDIGTIDAEGFLYVLDRRDDLIITGGENVYPAEIEAVIMAHPDVEEVAVVGADDAQWGQRVVAITRLRASNASTSADDMQAFCRTRLAGYKLPREFRFVTEPLPRTASGKLKRSVLRENLVTR